MINGKKAQVGQQMMFASFFFTLIIIGGGIAAGVYLFYGSGYDFRGVEAAVLNNQIGECILNNDINWNVRDDLYLKCNFDYWVVERTKADSGATPYVLGITAGDKLLFNLGDYKACEFSAEKKSKEYPTCVMTNVVKNGVTYKIVAGSAQRARNILG